MYDGALSRARELLPIWVPWLATFLFPAIAFVLTFEIAGIGALWFARRLDRLTDAHWTVRAREFHHLRQWVGGTTFSIALLAWFASSRSPNALAWISTSVRCLLCLAAAGIAASIVLRIASNRYVPAAQSGRNAASRVLSQLGFRWLPIVPMIVVGLTLPEHPDVPRIVGAVLLSLCGIVLSFGANISVLGWFGLAQRVELAELRVSADFPFRRVWVVDLPLANAFALPISKQVVVTRSMCELLTPGELTAVLRHESSHLQRFGLLHGSAVVMVIAAQLLGWSAPIAARFGEWVPTALWVGLFVGAAQRRRLSQREEDEADRHAASAPGAEQDTARALEKLYAASLIPAVQSRRAAHADLYDRMLAAGVAPAWPKPEPPSRRVAQTTFWLGMAAFIATMFCLYRSPAAIEKRTRSELISAFGISDHVDESLCAFAHHEIDAELYDDALIFYRAAAAANPVWEYPPAALSILESWLGRCADARADLDEAYRRAEARDSAIDRAVLDQAQNSLRECR